MDPSLNGLEADVFWLPSMSSRVLRAYVSREASPGWSNAISLGELRCQKTILDPASGEQQLLLCDRTRVVQILCKGDSIAIDPMAMNLVVGDLDGIEQGIRLFRPFAELYRHNGCNQVSLGWTSQSLGLRNALIALDGLTHGASHREVAEVIFGPDRAAEEWAGGHGWMKSRVVRAVKKGQYLVRGGYRDLLK